MKPQPKIVFPGLLVVLVGVLVGTGSFTFFYAEGASYFQSEPEACANCHVMQPYYDSWAKSSHRPVAVCNDCHMPDNPLHKVVAKADNGVRHAWKFTLESYEEPLKIIPRNSRILQNNCVDCHQAVVQPIVDDDRGPSCVECHLDVGHALQR